MRNVLVAGLIGILVPAAYGANLGAVVPAARSGPAAMFARGSPLPDLTFSFVTVEKTTYPVLPGARSVAVNDYQRDTNACQQPFGFPLQLIVKNIGQADFVPKGDSFQVVGINIGPWNSAANLARIGKGESQAINFNASLPPGHYNLQAMIDLHNEVAEARSDNNTLNWPLEVKCDIHSLAPAPITAPAFLGGSVTKRPPPSR